MRQMAANWGARLAIVVAVIGGTVWAYLDDAVPVVAIPLIAAGLLIAMPQLPARVRPVQKFIARLFLFGSIFEIAHAILDDERYDLGEVLGFGAVVAVIYATCEYVAYDDAPPTSTAGTERDKPARAA